MEIVKAYKVGERVFSTKAEAAKWEASRAIEAEIRASSISLEWLLIPANWNWLKYHVEQYIEAIKSE